MNRFAQEDTWGIVFVKRIGSFLLPAAGLPFPCRSMRREQHRMRRVLPMYISTRKSVMSSVPLKGFRMRCWIVACALLATLGLSLSPAMAGVVYTPCGVTVKDNVLEQYYIDMNNDGTDDFLISYSS